MVRVRASAGTGAPSGNGQYSGKPELSGGSFGNLCSNKVTHSFPEGTISKFPKMENLSLQRISVGDREFTILGTAHISQESIQHVEQAIREEMPDRVCVELDAGRLKALTEPDRWKTLDLRSVIRQGQLSTLVANLMLSSYQKRMGLQTGVRPGQELLAAVEASNALGIPVDLADREVKITLRRAWRMTPLRRKFLLMGALIESLFDRTHVSEDQLREIRQQDTLGAMMDEFGKTFPELRQVVISERDHFLAGRIQAAQGKRVLAVVGAGHVKGITEILTGTAAPMPEAEISFVPPPSPVLKWLAYSMPVLFIGAMVAIGLLKGMGAVGDNLIYWALMTGLPAAFGALLAFGHPAVVIVAFLIAPLKPLRPFIGVGTYTALTQLWFMPPRVEEMESVSEDIVQVKLWWKNRLLRIFLCFILPSLFTLAGEIVAGWHIFKNLTH